MDRVAAIRLGFFFGVLAIMALWELLAPRRPLSTSKGARWFANLGLVLIDTLALRLLFPITLAAFAHLLKLRGWGLLNQLSLPSYMLVALGVIGLDLLIYLQHAMFHAIPAFWRLHLVHHTDLDFDVTTGVRFHPVEILLSMLIKMAGVAALGISALAVVLFEILLNGTSMFNHGNVKLPPGIDRILRLLVVTPEMHRVHHSVIIREHNSNFGFNLPWWDRLLGTYRAQPAAGHQGMVIGLGPFRDPQKLSLPRLLALPFHYKPAHSPLGQPGSE
ncbi:MAG: sterol desaturase family protein [candidate division NC10 bacterium]|nr:sterol desaturase family protein [candidate division NC10 bacterium]